MAKTQTQTHITDVGTIGIPVTNQDRALDFYVGKLGFEKRIDTSYGQGERWVDVAPPSGTTTIALVKAPYGEHAGVDTQIRLMTRDAAADHAYLRSAGIDTDKEILQRPVPMFAFRDPDGNRLVIVEAPKGRQSA
jgi:catechol 2,3-dioxygenase-like lactoylglutathione lyase family enzyme